jgi:hypothetical protein
MLLTLKHCYHHFRLLLLLILLYFATMTNHCYCTNLSLFLSPSLSYLFSSSSLSHSSPSLPLSPSLSFQTVFAHFFIPLSLTQFLLHKQLESSLLIKAVYWLERQRARVILKDIPIDEYVYTKNKKFSIFP